MEGISEQNVVSVPQPASAFEAYVIQQLQHATQFEAFVINQLQHASAFEAHVVQKLDQIDTTIGTMQGSIGTMQGSIGTMQGSIVTVQGSIVTMWGSIKATQGSIQTMQGSIGTMQDSIETLQGSVKTIWGSIQGLEHSVDDLCESVMFITNNMVMKDQLDEILNEHLKKYATKEDVAHTEFRIKVYIDNAVATNKEVIIPLVRKEDEKVNSVITTLGEERVFNSIQADELKSRGPFARTA